MTRTRMTAAAFAEVNGLRPGWCRDGSAFDAWWEQAKGDSDAARAQQTELIELGKRWFESGTSPGCESLLNAKQEWRRKIAEKILYDIAPDDPARGNWRGEDGFRYSWNGIAWSRGEIASKELRGIETLPHATAACGIRGCQELRCKDSLQRMRTLARIPGRPVRKVFV